jgi:hypothetical protein
MYALILFYCIDICRWLSSKEIHKEDIRYWKREIPQLMCQMQQYLPPIFFNAQEHYLTHQVEEIELCELVHTRSMWMVEKQLKSLKYFVRQRACLEDSMVEGYMVYQCMVYISQYPPKLVENMNVPHIWHLNSINKFEGEFLLGKGKMTMKGNY